MFKDLFIKSSYQKMLSFLSLNAGKSFHERELVRKIGIGAGSANRVLNHLFKVSVIKRERRGNMNFYSLDEEKPAIKQFKVLNMILRLDPLIEKLKALTKTIVLYGSSSQGTDDYESDIDLFIVTSREEKVMEVVDEFNFSREIKLTLKTPSGWLELESKDPTFYNEVTRGIVLWEKPIDESKL